MAYKKKPPAHENHERWLVSYADFITLLFAFFVVMFASSQTDKGKAQAVSDAIKEAIEKGGISAVVKEVLGGTVDNIGKGNALMKGPGGSNKTTTPNTDPNVAELLPAVAYLNDELKEELKSGKMHIELETRGLVISLRQAAFFPSGEDVVDPATYAALAKVAASIRDLPNPIRLEGHTDAIPIHTARFRSNWELSSARAIAMIDLLVDKFGIPRQRLAVIGYAETCPIASNDDEEGRRRNRRVDIVILSHRAAMQQATAAHGAAKPSPSPAAAKPSPNPKKGH